MNSVEYEKTKKEYIALKSILNDENISVKDYNKLKLDLYLLESKLVDAYRNEILKEEGGEKYKDLFLNAYSMSIIDESMWNQIIDLALDYELG
jgi:hypothetical protein